MATLDPQSCIALVQSRRWLDKVSIQPDGCWRWTAASSAIGYGFIGLDGKARLAHRVALVAHLGRDILPGMHAGHLCHDLAVMSGQHPVGNCDHRRCVNPAHLTEQTPGENLQGIGGNQNTRKTHCPQGHPLSGDNVIVRQRVPSRQYPSGVTRECRECNRAKKRKTPTATDTVDWRWGPRAPRTAP